MGLPNQKAVTPSVAANLVRVLRGSDAKRSSLIDMLSMLVRRAFDNADELSVEDCGLLLSKETAEKVLEEANFIRAALLNMVPLPVNLVDLILVDVIRRDLPSLP